MTFASEPPRRIPAGWYVHPDDPAWQQYWDGTAWTSAIAPLAPDAPQSTEALTHDTLSNTPETEAPRQPDAEQSDAISPPDLKETDTAYLLAILLGTFGGHQIYLGNVGSAIGFTVLWWGGWVLSFVGGFVVVSVYYGFIAVAAAFIWWIVDLCTMPLQVAAANRRLIADLG